MSYAGDAQVLQYLYRKTTAVLHIGGINMIKNESKKNYKGKAVRLNKGNAYLSGRAGGKSQKVQIGGSKLNLKQMNFTTSLKSRQLRSSLRTRKIVWRFNNG